MELIIIFFVLWLIFELVGGGSSSSSHTNLKNKENQKNSLKPTSNKKEILRKEPERQANKNISPMHPVKRTGETSDSKKNFSNSLEETNRDLDLYISQKLAEMPAEMKRLPETDDEFEDIIEIKVESEQINLSHNQIAIKNFIESRNITQLIHFTRYENLEGIIKHGLLTRSELNILRMPSFMNDNLRLDGNENSISLSISFPNYKMFYKYRRNTLAKGWVVIAINPSVLWEYDCSFCRYNAADSRISNLPKTDLKGIKSLKEMFSENESNFGIRKQERLEDFDPTDPQAEVLVFANIPKDKILFFGFENSTLLTKCKSKYFNSNAVMANKYFNSRIYAR